MKIHSILLSLMLMSMVFPLTAQEEMKGLYERELNAFEQRRLFKRMPALDEYDIVHNKLYLKVDPAIRFIDGNVVAHFVAKKKLDSIKFNLKDDLEVEYVKHKGFKIGFSHKEDVLTIYFNLSVANGTKDSVEIKYKGVPPSGRGYFVQDLHLTGPSIHTLSEPYGAEYWWPCKQTLTDKIDSLDVWVETDTTYKAGSNGLLVSQDLMNDSTILYHWKHRYPIATYLVAIVVSNFHDYSFYAPINQGQDSILVQNYVWPESLDDTLNRIPKVAELLNLYDSLFGEYPFIKEKYGHAQFVRGGGMEHQTMSFMGDFSYDLIAHELAHQWFGDKVTCGSWESLWINEGFATYLTDLAYEFLDTDSAWKKRLQSTITFVTKENFGSVFPIDTQDVSALFSSRLTYEKASFIIHMIRWRLGDDLFYQGIRNFLNAPEHAYAFGLTHDLKGHWENVSGMDLDPFFDDWFYGEGFPIYSISWGQENDEVQVRIAQSTSHPSVDFFENDVELEFKGEGQDTTIRFGVFNPNVIETVQLPFKVSDVKFDPNCWLLAKASVTSSSFKKVIVFPNPATNFLTIESGIGVINSLQVIDETGREVLSLGKNDISSPLSHSIDIQSLRKGVYGLYVALDSEYFWTKFVVE